MFAVTLLRTAFKGT